MRPVPARPEVVRTLPPADAAFDPTVAAAPSGPARSSDGGGSRRRVAVLLGIAALLLVGGGLLVQQFRSGDDHPSVLGTSIERSTTTTAAMPGVAGTPATAATASTVDVEPAPSAPPTPPAARPDDALAEVTGVVRITWLVTDAAVAADPAQRPPTSCAEATGQHRVRIGPGAGGATVPLTERGEAFRGRVDDIASVVCDYTYVADLSAGNPAVAFELVTPTGEVADSRQVSAADLGTGVGPFLGRVVVIA